MTFSLPGFSTVKREGIELTSSFTATIDAEMRVGSSRRRSRSRARARSSTCRTSSGRRVISREMLDSLPTNKESAPLPRSPSVPCMPANQQDVGGNKDPILAFVSIHGSRSRMTRN